MKSEVDYIPKQGCTNPRRQIEWQIILYADNKYVWALNLALASCHHSGA
jgi:hypothetical protein